MSEPKRLESVLPEAADRDSQAEALLVIHALHLAAARVHGR